MMRAIFCKFSQNRWKTVPRYSSKLSNDMGRSRSAKETSRRSLRPSSESRRYEEPYEITSSQERATLLLHSDRRGDIRLCGNCARRPSSYHAARRQRVPAYYLPNAKAGQPFRAPSETAREDRAGGTSTFSQTLPS